MKNIDLLNMQLSFYKELGDGEKVAETEKKILASKRGRRSKTKGGNYERTIAKLLNDRFKDLEFARTPSSGGFQKKSSNTTIRGDLSNLNEHKDFLIHLELKNHKNWAIKDWWKQCTEDCPKGKYPALIVHRGQENAEGKRITNAEDFIFLRLDDFLSVLDETKVIVDKNMKIN